MRQCAPHAADFIPLRLTRLYVPGSLRVGEAVPLPQETGAHIAKVLRARSGDPLVVFNGEGREYHGAIDTVRGPRVSVLLTAESAVSRESPLEVVLVQAIPRGDRMDFVVQKATELGVARIVPVFAERSVVRLNERQQESRLAHWRGVAISACEQCGRNRLPAIEPPVELITHLARRPAPALRLVLDPDACAAPAPAVGSPVEISIGPEGGFSVQELEAMRLQGFSALRLGPRILRSETAALAALCFLQMRHGDMGPDTPC